MSGLALSRRELFRIGALSVVCGFVAPLRRANAWTERRVTPRGSARQVLFVNLEGGMSQLDSFDAKEGAWTPDYFDIRSCAGGLKLPMGLMKRLAGVIGQTSVVRSMAAWDSVHGRAQYYIQTGHPLNLAFAKEVPAIGAVVCHELAGQRRATDSLPAYMAMNMAGNQAGLIQHGFLSAEFGPLSLSVDKNPPRLAPAEGTAGVLRRRYERLQELDQSLRSGQGGVDRSFADYHQFYRGAWDIMNDPRVPEVFRIRKEDTERYGATGIGNSLVLARNLFRADAGTRFILANHGGWDHHSDIYKPNTRNHPVLIRELDAALSSLIEDLQRTPSPRAAGKTLLDETLIVCMSEFGRTPGKITDTRAGREHYIHAHCGLLAGGGIKRGAVLGATNEDGGKITDFGWSAGRAIYMEDIACTIYSALGIDWTKRVTDTPSGRAYHYIESASGTTYMEFRPVNELFAERALYPWQLLPRWPLYRWAHAALALPHPSLLTLVPSPQIPSMKDRLLTIALSAATTFGLIKADDQRTKELDVDRLIVRKELIVSDTGSPWEKGYEDHQIARGIYAKSLGEGTGGLWVRSRLIKAEIDDPFDDRFHALESNGSVRGSPGHISWNTWLGGAWRQMAIIQGEGLELSEVPREKWDGTTHPGRLRFQSFRPGHGEPLTDAIIGQGMMSIGGGGYGGGGLPYPSEVLQVWGGALHQTKATVPEAPIVVKDDGSGEHHYQIIAVGPQGRRSGSSPATRAKGIATLRWGGAPGADSFVVLRDGKEIAGPLRIEGSEKVWTDKVKP